MSEPSLLEAFLNQPVIVETAAGQVIGVLVRADVSVHGGIGSLLIDSFTGSWFLVKEWTAIKSGSSST